KKAGGQSLLNCFVTNAYAQEDLSPEVKNAALNRKNRRSELASWESKGVIGENSLGLVEIRSSDKGGSEAAALVQAENNDRMVIYQAVAKKNGTSVDEVQKLYAKRLQADAPAGTPIEAANGSGNSGWKTK
ncbi:MAG: DUF1318 domain-containing protein, partial [Candidatus Omnitrophica bacterium]|nr:DUF1318 domain-containing protein [Candidatus Omnitrophota bacterium]